MSLPPGIDAAARDVAQSLSGGRSASGARIVTVQPLTGGTGASTGGLRLYRLDGGGAFIEKRTTSELEYTLARAQLVDTAAGLPRCPAMLRYLAAMPDPAGGYRLFMERLEEVGGNDSWLWGAEARLAEAAEAFSLAIAAMRRRHGLALRPAPDVLAMLGKALTGTKDATDAQLATLRSALAGYPLRPAHNDLFWPNIGQSQDAETLVFLDFALVGDNLPGAEFHHFAKGLTKSARHRAFFLALTLQAAERASIPAGIMRAGACVTAAARARTRETRRGRPEEGQRLARRFLGLAEDALQERSSTREL
ncbi:MAG: hypothetical protein JJU19_14530 [Pararhodobacter sp.]|nr:hypothetical protein [Pararhodobacter sp.]